MPLTDTAVRNAKLTGKPQKLAYTEGLYLFISPAQLNIAESTVHTHRKRIRNKLCVPGGQNLYAYLKNYEF